MTMLFPSSTMTMFFPSFFFSAVTAIVVGFSVAQPAPTTPLNEASFVFPHNAATGYLMDPGILDDPLAAYSKNQNSTFSEQLGCGARAFDLEPAELENDIFFRHGQVLVKEISFKDGVQEILNWPNTEGDLILLKIVSCGGTCQEGVQSILVELGVELITDCSELQALTYGQALQRGPVLAIAGDCFEDNFDPTLSCHGFLPDNDPGSVQKVRNCVPADFDSGADDILSTVAQIFNCLKENLTPELVNLYDCWKDEFPHDRLRDYLQATASAGPPQNGKLWQWQGLWQVNEDSILLGVFRPVPLPTFVVGLDPTGILRDIQESQVNRRVLEYTAELVQNGVTLNLVEVDGVCDPYASQLYSVLRGGTLPPTPPATMEPTAAPTPAPTSIIQRPTSGVTRYGFSAVVTAASVVLFGSLF